MIEHHDNITPLSSSILIGHRSRGTKKQPIKSWLNQRRRQKQQQEEVGIRKREGTAMTTITTAAPRVAMATLTTRSGPMDSRTSLRKNSLPLSSYFCQWKENHRTRLFEILPNSASDASCFLCRESNESCTKSHHEDRNVDRCSELTWADL